MKKDVLTAFKDPISSQCMRDPVMCTLDGVTYERKNIIQYLKDNKKTPKGIPLELNNGDDFDKVINKFLIQNTKLRDAIDNMEKGEEFLKVFEDDYLSYEYMEDPVICTLDKQTYERKNIIAYLNDYKRTPMNAEPISDVNAVIEKCLITNTSLKEAFDEYKKNHPKWDEDNKNQQSNAKLYEDKLNSTNTFLKRK